MKNILKITGILCLFAFGGCFANGFNLPVSSIIKPLPPMSGDIKYASTENGKPGFLDMSRQGSDSDKLSLKKGLLLSFLLPGAGEYYAGAKTRGQIFMGVEAAIWTGFIGYQVYGNWKEDDYKRIATAHADVNHDGKDDVFYDMIGFYSNRTEYNQFGRLFYPDRPYYADNDSYYWQWDSEARRLEYKRLKEDSKTALRNSTFMLGLALANRVVSAIDTYRTIKSANKKIKSITQLGEYHLEVSPKVFSDNPTVTVTLTRKF
ncbi:MAG: hypothetical protein KAR42_14475 [candidate division Zixibacteria bacterium]|nr:hypothetical protein [candidate division Zixibacteria bacterium]